MIGAMPMPADFPYAEVLRKGQPVHTPTDDFRLKHPSMPAGRRAKIFSPFDALKGFNEAVASKEVLYELRRQLSEGEIEELDRRLNILHALTQTHALAKQNCVMATAVFFVPCRDSDNASYGSGGQYVTVTGRVWQVNRQFLLLDERKIALRDLTSLENAFTEEGRELFAETFEEAAP